LGHIRYQIAQAYIALGKPEQASDLLQQAAAHFKSGGDVLMLAECTGSQATLAYLTQQPEALELAERALAMCRGLNPVPNTTEARLLAILANVNIVNHDWDLAAKHYMEAIEVAGSLYDLRRLAKMYNGLSITYREKGQVEVAGKYAHRSLALLEVLHDRISMARVENELGLILMAKGDHASARKHLDRSLELSEETDLETGRSHVLLSLCELSLQEGHVESAGEFAERALGLAERLHEGLNIAEAHMWLGRVADQRGDVDAVDREFETALHGLAKFGSGERLLRCNGMYAEILERRGDLERAYVHMKKALSASRPGLLRDQGEPAAERAGSA
jgi:tetratricopeptide (TPR) repeat protein